LYLKLEYLAVLRVLDYGTIACEFLKKLKYSFSPFVFRETAMHAQNFETD
jgi:hypothetical protein